VFAVYDTMNIDAKKDNKNDITTDGIYLDNFYFENHIMKLVNYMHFGMQNATCVFK